MHPGAVTGLPKLENTHQEEFWINIKRLQQSNILNQHKNTNSLTEVFNQNHMWQKVLLLCKIHTIQFFLYDSVFVFTSHIAIISICPLTQVTNTTNKKMLQTEKHRTFFFLSIIGRKDIVSKFGSLGWSWVRSEFPLSSGPLQRKQLCEGISTTDFCVRIFPSPFEFCLEFRNNDQKIQVHFYFLGKRPMKTTGMKKTITQNKNVIRS